MKALLHKGMEASPEKYLPHLITEAERAHFEKMGISTCQMRSLLKCGNT